MPTLRFMLEPHLEEIHLIILKEIFPLKMAI